MSKQSLAKLVDPDALAKETGTIGRIAFAIPESWLTAGVSLAVDVPRRVECARCEGGGCDGCVRSGAHRIVATDRTVKLHLPAESPAAVRLRLAQPFADDALSQLWVDIRVGEAAPAHVHRLATVQPSPSHVSKLDAMPWVVLFVVLVMLGLWASL